MKERIKRFVPFAIVATVTFAIPVCQRLITFGLDDFTVTPEGHKVFTYGFPFRIVDCNATLPMHMGPREAAWRFASNFAVFFSAGMLAMEGIHRMRKHQAHV